MQWCKYILCPRIEDYHANFFTVWLNFSKRKKKKEQSQLVIATLDNFGRCFFSPFGL